MQLMGASTHVLGDRAWPAITDHAPRPVERSLRSGPSVAVRSWGPGRAARARLGRLGLAVASLAIVLAALAPSALALNPERHYEMVSPVYKGGYGTGGGREQIVVASNGESVAYFAVGIFNEAPSAFAGELNYLARRGPSGWATTPVVPPAEIQGSVDETDLSESLGQILSVAAPGRTTSIVAGDIFDVWAHSTSLPDLSANWELLGAMERVEKLHTPASPEYFTATPDLCHVLLAEPGVGYLSDATGATEPLYEFARGCHGEPASLTLVSQNNAGQPLRPGCHAGLGGKQYTEKSTDFHALSSDGETVFFTVCVAGNEINEQAPHQLFVRLGGSRTVEISRPLTGVCEADKVIGEVPCDGASARPSADFAGASEDGSIVYFTTAAPLNEVTDTDTSNDVYAATIGCPAGGSGCASGERVVTSMVQVSHDPNGGAAEVQGVVRVASGGRRVYYVARGDLLTPSAQEALEAEGRPVPLGGADNLYVSDLATASTEFIGDLCSGGDASGAVEDVSCPAGEEDSALWSSGDDDEAQVAGPEGEFLVFASVAQLTGDDTNSVKDVYRYDASTNALQRVSLGEDGYAANGDASTLGSQIRPGQGGGRGQVWEQYELSSRAVSEDGSRIVFTSAAPHSPAATNGLTNAYEWHETPGEPRGHVSIVSTGNAERPVTNAVISANGRSVVFSTTQGLVAQDTDGAADIYDAILGDGFAPPPAEARPCQGDACQGSLTSPPAQLIPGSVTQQPGGNLPVAGPPKVTTKLKPRDKAVKCRRGFVKRNGRCVKTHPHRKARKSGRDREASR